MSQKPFIFFLITVTLAGNGLFFFGGNQLTDSNFSSVTGTGQAYAQTVSSAPSAVTPTLFCMGSCPELSPTNPLNNGTAPSQAAGNVSPSTGQPVSSVAPCSTESTVTVQRHRHQRQKSGKISQTSRAILNLLIQLINLILQLIGGGTPGSVGGLAIPTVAVTPQPTQPDISEIPTSGPNPSLAAPSDAPSTAPTGNASAAPSENPSTAPSDNPTPTPCPSASQTSGAPSTQPSSSPVSQQPSGAAPLTVIPSTGGPSGTQTLGCGGIPAPAPGPNVILTPSDSTAPLSITAGGTAGNPKIYDGQCKTVGRIDIKTDHVTVQNFKVNANSQYGIFSEGTGNTIQNNDIKGIRATGDGDLNAITFFGNDTKIMYNTAIDFVTGSPGGSHTDGIQTWISSSHPTGSTNVLIKGNKFTGPANPARDNNIPSIHQCVMVEGPGRGGNSGGNGTSSNWIISDNFFSDSWNQCIKLDGVDNVTVTRNEFAGSSDKIMNIPLAPGFKYFSDNKVTGQYKNGVGAPVTQGAGPQ